MNSNVPYLRDSTALDPCTSSHYSREHTPAKARSRSVPLEVAFVGDHQHYRHRSHMFRVDAVRLPQSGPGQSAILSSVPHGGFLDRLEKGPRVRVGFAGRSAGRDRGPSADSVLCDRRLARGGQTDQRPGHLASGSAGKARQRNRAAAGHLFHRAASQRGDRQRRFRSCPRPRAGRLDPSACEQTPRGVSGRWNWDQQRIHLPARTGRIGARSEQLWRVLRQTHVRRGIVRFRRGRKSGRRVACSGCTPRKQ